MNVIKLRYRKKTLPPAGKHMGVLVDLKEIDNPFFNPKTDPPEKAIRLEWTFAYEDKPDIKINAWSAGSLNSYQGKKSKTQTITEALLERELTEEEKEKFSESGIEDLIGKKCLLNVEHLPGRDGKLHAKITEFGGLPF